MSVRLSMLFVLLTLTNACFADDIEFIDQFEGATARAIMEAVYERHQQYPYVYEEQSMILIDRFGHKDTRKLRRYSRTDETGTSNFLLLFDSPVDVKGVALLASRDSGGDIEQSFYLPAFGSFLRNSADGSQQEDSFLGTDYSVENLVGELLDDHLHVRLDDEVIDETDYYVVDVHHLDDTELSRPLRRHFILKETLFVDRTDHFDELGRLKKRQTQHDLTNVHGDMWRANMMMMENRVEQHRTVIKIDRRVFSADYVPAEVFEHEWIRSQGVKGEGAFSQGERAFSEGERAFSEGERAISEGVGAFSE